MKKIQHREIPIDWLIGVKNGTTEEKEKRKDEVLSSIVGLLLLKQILEDKIEAKTRTNESDYDSPSWAYKRADRDGYVRALEDILKLLPNP